MKIIFRKGKKKNTLQPHFITILELKGKLISKTPVGRFIINDTNVKVKY